MMLAEPQPTPYDFHFVCLGFPVRITPFFWVAAAVLGWDYARVLGDQPIADNPGQAAILGMWITAVLVSILVHELGHTLAMRYYGLSSSIVLYHFGGLAIPGVGGSWGRIARLHRREDQLLISAAGPAAQIALALVILGAIHLAGYRPIFAIWPLNYVLPESNQPTIPSFGLALWADCLISPSISWALLNLLPIYPLDGGQIARELFTRFGSRQAVRDSLSLSLVTAIGMAVYSYSTGQSFLAMFFISMAFSSYQLLQMYRWGGGGW